VKPTSQDFLSAAAQERISEAVKKAESKTSGEIVPVLATASDPYDRGLFLASLASWLLATLVVIAFFLLPIESFWPETWDLPYAWEVPAYILLPFQLVALIGGYYLARSIPRFHRSFIPRAVMQRRVNAAAHQAFLSLQISQTRDATGIMLYVSLFEHMVVVVADKAINERHDAATWNGIRDLLVEGLKNNKPDEGFSQAIARCGEILAEHFPIKSDDTNELSNHLRLV
jgi:putative membrane protein